MLNFKCGYLRNVRYYNYDLSRLQQYDIMETLTNIDDSVRDIAMDVSKGVYPDTKVGGRIGL